MRKKIREKIELINQVEYPDNYNLTLVLARRKNVTDLGFCCYENGNKDTYDMCENCRKKIDTIIPILSLLNLPFYLNPVEKKPEDGWGYNFLQIYIGKNKKCLNRIINAKTDEELGKCYGFPRTAIKAFGDEDKMILLTSFILPEKFKHLEHFLQFVSSKEYLKREMRRVKHWAKIVKRRNPVLYYDMMPH